MFSNTLLALDTILNTPGNYDCKALSQDASKKKKKKEEWKNETFKIL